MKKTILAIAVLFMVLSVPATAGEIPNLLKPSEVHDLVSKAMTEWKLIATSATGCGGGNCCPAAAANDQCTAAGVPKTCCAGAGAGTCNLEACERFAIILVQQQSDWVDEVAARLYLDGDWLCSTWPEGNRFGTVCTVVSGTPIIDVGRICSEIAQVRSSP